jgi:hypothetical protein
MNTSKLIENRIELNNSSALAIADPERGPPDPALGEPSLAIDLVGLRGVVTVLL